MASLQYVADSSEYDKFARSNFNYSQAVKLGNGIVKCSGQGGWEDNGDLIGKDTSEQIEKAFKNVDRVLRKAGCNGWQDVYSVRSYHVELKKYLDKFVEVFKQWTPSHQPIWTCIGVTELGAPNMNVEIEVEAYNKNA
ncbi:YjgF-like protein [Wallemia mellicola]|nr:YjgF-like protein [Wallemia mellicola]